MPSNYTHLLKLLLIGPPATGKSSLLLRFVDGTFNDDIQPTIGVDFKVKVMDIAGNRIKISVWDTAGQERFRTLTSAYYRGSQGVILVYDVSSMQSFEEISHWNDEVNLLCRKDVVKVLVGNKVDLCEGGGRREVHLDVGSDYAQNQGMYFLEASAKDGRNVTEAFEEVISQIVANKELMKGTETKRAGGGVTVSPIGDEQNNIGGGCC